LTKKTFLKNTIIFCINPHQTCLLVTKFVSNLTTFYKQNGVAFSHFIRVNIYFGGKVGKSRVAWLASYPLMLLRRVATERYGWYTSQK
jgi:hypothetical protein